MSSTVRDRSQIPSFLRLCQCPDCVDNPAPHPVTGLPSTGASAGRWIPQNEYNAHKKRARDSAVASTIPSGTSGPPPAAFVGFSEPSFHTRLQDPSASPSQGLAQELLPSPEPLAQRDDTVADLKRMQSQLRNPEDVLGNNVLYFERPPNHHVPVDTSSLSEIEIERLCELDSNAPSNSTMIGFQQMLSRTKRHGNDLSRSPNVGTRLQAKTLVKSVEQRQSQLRALLLKEWLRQRSALKQPNYFDTALYYLSPVRLLPHTVLAIYLLVATLQLLSGISLDDCTLVIGFLHVIMDILSETSTSIFAGPAAQSLVTDPRTVIKILDVNPRSRAYICCPRCFYLYWVDPDSQTIDYPDSCTNTAGGAVCGARLWKSRRTKNGETTLPFREFIYQSPKEYLARLYARQDLEQYLYGDPTQFQPPSNSVWDIWDAPCLRQFKGPDRKPFTKAPAGESRIMLSLNMDGFNPYRNREAGKKVTVGAMYMICLNLPPSLRYKLENIYLMGIIPGPQAPSEHEINYLLQPLVDDLLELWDPGVYLSRTTRYPHGHRVRCALRPLVCDLPAARQMSGFAHYRSKHFCSQCFQPLDQINDLNYTTWKPRTWKSHRFAAQKWRDAKSIQEREACMNTYGVRWSELLRLEYWDPTRFTIIDSMHAFYLRLFQYHCRSIWGMDINFDDGDGITFDITPNHPSEDEMKHATHILRHGTEEMLRKLKAPILRELCRQASTLPFRRKKCILLDQLIKYRVRQNWFTEDGDHIPDQADQRAESPSPDASMFNDSQQFHNVSAVRTFFYTASKTAMNDLRKPDLLIVFKLEVLPSLSLSALEVSRLNVPELHKHILSKRHELGITGSDGKLLAPAPKKTRVLGKGVLSEVRRDMDRLGQPTWVARAPAHPGEKKWGKFTADQWRTFCLQNLPVTLIRLWGGKPKDSTERRRLDNFMHLVSAVKLATMHRMDEARILKYEEHMHKYLTSLLELYPGTSVTPYQHLALHFGNQLRLFGPVHAWRCFPFERFNYDLQKIPTNERFGELEKTMFTKFCCGQNLRALYNIDAVPESLHKLIQVFQKRYASDFRGTRLSDVFAHEERFGILEAPKKWEEKDLRLLSTDDFKLLSQWMTDHHPGNQSYSRSVVFRDSVHRFGQRFVLRGDSIDNSHVIFRLSERDDWEAGSITTIFSQASHPITQTWAVIQPYVPIPPDVVDHDHYRSFTVAGGRLFRNLFANTAVLIDVKNIECHFASCVLQISGIDGDCCLALPLNKV